MLICVINGKCRERCTRPRTRQRTKLPKRLQARRAQFLNSTMTSLMLNINNWDDVLAQLPDAWLRKAQIFFYAAFPIYGAAALGCGIYQNEDRLLMALGTFAVFYAVLVKYLPILFKLVYTMWLHLSVLLVLIGVALERSHKGLSNSFTVIGGIFAAFFVISPLLGCNVLAGREARPPEPAVAFQAIRQNLDE